MSSTAFEKYKSIKNGGSAANAGGSFLDYNSRAKDMYLSYAKEEEDEEKSAFERFRELRKGESAEKAGMKDVAVESSPIETARAEAESREKSAFERFRELRKSPSAEKVGAKDVAVPNDQLLQKNTAEYKAAKAERAEQLDYLEKKKRGEIPTDEVKAAQDRLAAYDTDTQKTLESYGASFYNDSDQREKLEDRLAKQFDFLKTDESSQADQSAQGDVDSFIKGNSQKSEKKALGIDTAAEFLKTPGIKNTDAQKMASELKEKNGWSDDELNSAIADAKAVAKFQNEDKSGQTYLTPEEEQIYNRASIEALSDGEQEAMSLIEKGYYQNASDDSKYNTWVGTAGVASGYVMKALGEAPDYGEGYDWIDEGKQMLKDVYGWEDDQIHEYELRAKRLGEQRNAESVEKDINDMFSKSDNAAAKAGKGLAAWAYSGLAAIPSMASVASNLEDRPEGQGRNMYSNANTYKLISESMSKAVQNNYLSEDSAIDNTKVGQFIKDATGGNVGQFLYGASESIRDSAILMYAGGAIAEGLGVAGAGAAVSAATKGGETVTTAMRNAATVETIVKNASMVPFMVSGYESAYEQAREEGASEQGAQLRGAAGGLAEYITEKVSLDNAWEIAQGTRAGKNIIVNLLMQGGIEGTEEMSSDLLNDIADHVISEALQDKLSGYDQRVQAYMDEGMNEETAAATVKKEKAKEYLADGIAGALSGLVMGTGASVQGYQTARYNKERSKAVSDYYEEQGSNTSDTEYGESQKAQAEKYKNNPTQYYADMVDDSTEEGRKAKKNLQGYADREAQGKRLNASDRLDVERSIAVAESASKGQEAYQNYVREVSRVPDAYRSALSTMTVDEAQRSMAEAAGKGDVRKLSDTYQAMKNSTSAEMRNRADDIYEQFYGMAENNGVAREQLDALKMTPQDAYMEGMKGTSRENLGAISSVAAEAYNEGAKQRLKAGRYIVESAETLRGNVQTEKGEVSLSGSFDADGKIVTGKGSISTSEMTDATAVKQAYVNAETQKTVTAKNAYIANIKDGVNLHQYDYGFNIFYRAGATGVSYEAATNDGFSQTIEKVLGADTTKAIYDAGMADYKAEVSREASAVIDRAMQVKRGSGTFTDARTGEKADINTDFMDLVAKATGLDVVLANKNDYGQQASFSQSDSMIVVTEDHASQLIHELGEFAEVYAGEEYAKLRDAVAESAAQILGADRYQRTVDSYQKTYEKVHDDQTVYESSKEMTNDYLVALMSTKEGQKALAEHMVDKYGAKEAKTLGEKIKDFFSRIADSIRNMFDNTSLNSYQKKVMESKINGMEDQIGQFLHALDVAIENYGRTEGKDISETRKKTETDQDVGFSLAVTDEGYQYVNVDVDQAQFDGKSMEEKRALAHKVITDKFVRNIIGYKEGAPVVETQRGAKEYSYADKRYYTAATRNAKMRASTELDALLNASKFVDHADYEEVKARHPEAYGGFDQYKTLFKVGKDWYVGIVNIMNQKNVRSLYDITKIRSIDQNEIPTEIGSLAESSAPMDIISRYLENGKKFSLELDPFFDIFDGSSEYSEGASILEEGMEALKNKKVDGEVVKKIAVKLRNEYGSKINVGTFSDMMQSAFAYMQTTEHVSYDDMMRIMNEIAKPVIEQCTHNEGAETYETFVNALSGYKIKLDEAQLTEVRNTMGSYVDFKKAISPLRFSKNGVSLDSVWDEMVESSGYMLDRNIPSADQPLALYDALDALRPSPVNDFGGNAEDVSRDLAMRIVEEYFGAQNDEKLKKLSHDMKKKSAEYRKDVRQQYESRLADAKADMQSRISELKDKNKKEIAELKAKNKKNAQVARERREARAEREQISKNARKLMKWIAEPSDKYHVPNNLQDAVLSFVNALDFVEPDVKVDRKGQYSTRIFLYSVTDGSGKKRMVFDTITGDSRDEVLWKYYQRLNEGAGSQSVKAWKERMRTMESLLKAAKDGKETGSDELDRVVQMLDPEIADEFSDMLDANDGTLPINSLSAKDLRAVKHVLVNVAHAIDVGNKAITQNQSIEAMAKETIYNANNLRRKDHTVVYQKLHKNLVVDMATPSTFFALQGKPGEALYKSLNNGFTKKVQDIKEASEYMSRVMNETGVTKKEMKEWTGKDAETYTFQVHDGTFSLTTAQIMSLYELNKRKQAVLHYAGGVEAETRETGKVFRIQHTQKQAVHLTPGDLAAIFDKLTDKQIQLADAMQSYLANECAEKGNEASMLMYGYEKFTDPNYFPIRTDKNTIAVQSEAARRESLNGIERMGMTRQVNPHANNPIMIRDIFDVFTDHITDMAAYHGYAPVVKDMNRWVNYKTTSETEDDFLNFETVQKAINTNMGRTDNAGMDYYTKLIKDINNLERSGDVSTFWEGLVGNYKSAAVAGNLRVVIQQPTAFLRAANVINPKYLMSSVYKALPVVSGRNMKRITEISPMAWWKSQGYYETTLGRSVKEIVTGQSSFKDKLIEKTMALAGKADDITWSVLYSAVEKDQRAATKDMELSEEEYRKRVNERFDQMIAETQVVDCTIMKSQWMRSKGKLANLQTAFMAEPTKSYNMAMRAMIQDGREHGGNLLKWHRTMKAGVVLFVTNVVNAAAQSAIDGIRNKDDDETYLEAAVDSFFDNLVDNLNPMNLIPGVKDIFSMTMDALMGKSSYGSSTGKTMDMLAMSSLTDAIGTTVKLISGDYTKSGWGAYMTYAKAFSNLTGIPVYNISRDAVAIANMFEGVNVRSTKPKDSDKYQGTYEAVTEGEDVKDIQRYVDYAMEHNGTIKDIKSGISSRIRSDYLEALENGNKEKSDELKEKATNGFLAIGMTKAEAADEIEGWEDKKAGYSTLDKAITTGENISDEIKYLQENGKEDDEIVEHIVNEFSSTVSYNRKRKIESVVENNVEKALKTVDSSLNYDDAKAAVDEAARKSAEEKAITAEKEAARKELYDIIDGGDGDFRTAVNNWHEKGTEASAIKSALTTDYVKPLVKEYKNGNTGAYKKLRQIASVKAYIDEQTGKNIDEDYNGDYYKYEKDEIDKMMNKYDKEPW